MRTVVVDEAHLIVEWQVFISVLIYFHLLNFVLFLK